MTRREEILEEVRRNYREMSLPQPDETTTLDELDEVDLLDMIMEMELSLGLDIPVSEMTDVIGMDVGQLIDMIIQENDVV